MILLDNNQLILANLFQTLKQQNEIDIDLLRHLVLNTYRMYRTKFKSYGELVICQDSGNQWRRDIFPEYKLNRKKTQSKSKFDWNEIYNSLAIIRDEIVENFPYKSISIPRCEADDVIGVICKHYHQQEKIVIVSSDKDFQQLQRYPNIKQYSPIHKKFLVCEDPERFLLEHIIKGDSSDGVPNILSDNDVFVTDGKRQTGCGIKKVNLIIEDINNWNTTDNWHRNHNMVDLNQVPDWAEEQILAEFDKPSSNDRSKLFNYFVSNKLSKLIGSITEF
jgi:5'-3' exonuclease